MFIAIVSIPGMLLILFGLVSYQPYLRTQSPKFARLGQLGSLIGILGLFTAIVLYPIFLYITGGDPSAALTEDTPFSISILLITFLSLFINFLSYGIGGLTTETPSKKVGLFFLLPIILPLFGILNDFLGVDIPISGIVIALGLAGFVFLFLGYFINSEKIAMDTPTTT